MNITVLEGKKEFGRDYSYHNYQVQVAHREKCLSISFKPLGKQPYVGNVEGRIELSKSEAISLAHALFFAASVSLENPVVFNIEEKSPK